MLEKQKRGELKRIPIDRLEAKQLAIEEGFSLAKAFESTRLKSTYQGFDQKTGIYHADSTEPQSFQPSRREIATS